MATDHDLPGQDSNGGTNPGVRIACVHILVKFFLSFGSNAFALFPPQRYHFVQFLKEYV